MKTTITILISVMYGLVAIAQAFVSTHDVPKGSHHEYPIESIITTYNNHPVDDNKTYNADLASVAVTQSDRLANVKANEPPCQQPKAVYLTNVYIDGVQVAPNAFDVYQYALECGNTYNNVPISFQVPVGYTCNYPSGLVNLDVTAPGMHQASVWIESTTGQRTEYAMRVFKPYASGQDPFIVNKSNVVLIANNNPNTNTGYSFVDYKWYKNGQYVASGQNYYASLYGEKVLDLDAQYSVRLTSDRNEVLTTCPIVITDNLPRLGVYPNPVTHGDDISISLDNNKDDVDQPAMGNMCIEVYTVNGTMVHKKNIKGKQCTIQAPAQPGVYAVRITALDRNYINIVNLTVR